MADNMKLYNLGRTVPQEAMKEIKAGRLKGFTDINPMWRIKRLTEMFGPCGIGWWYTIKDKNIIHDEITKQAAAFVDIELFYVDPETSLTSHAIPGTGGSGFISQESKGAYMSDECFKMALTDAISVAAKSIGIGADVYYQKDRDKYNNPAPIGDVPPPTYSCSDCGAKIKDYTDQNGKVVRARKWAASSKDRFGRVLCLECVARAKANEKVTE